MAVDRARVGVDHARVGVDRARVGATLKRLDVAFACVEVVACACPSVSSGSAWNVCLGHRPGRGPGSSSSGSKH